MVFWKEKMFLERVDFGRKGAILNHSDLELNFQENIKTGEYQNR
jgi:hypothetical protein